jgi:hypothetical protein
MSRRLPEVKLPPVRPVSEKELARRRKIVDRILARRERIGPIGISADELVREARREADIEDYRSP